MPVSMDLKCCEGGLALTRRGSKASIGLRMSGGRYSLIRKGLKSALRRGLGAENAKDDLP